MQTGNGNKNICKLPVFLIRHFKGIKRKYNTKIKMANQF